MSAKVISVTPFHWGHTSVVLSDGSTHIFTRGEKIPKVGDVYPADGLPSAEDLDAAEFEKVVRDAMDKASSETAIVEGKPIDDGAAGSDEKRVAPESGDGPRKKGQQSAEAKEA